MSNIATIPNFKDDAEQLSWYEQRIETRAKAAFIDNGLDLAAIKERGVYKASHATFEDYVEERWEMDRTRAYQIIEAATLAQKMSTIVDMAPAKESHIRPLLRKLDTDDERVTVWQEVIDETNGKPKAKDVDAGVEIFLARKKKNWLTFDEWDVLNGQAQRKLLSTRHHDKFLNKQDNASIEWAQWSWNPVTGCNHDCKYCYARDIANRFYPQKFEPAIYPERLSNPYNTKVPHQAETDTAYKNIFTCSMADLFGKWVPEDWINSVLKVAADNPQWNFLCLTKNPQRYRQFNYTKNVWLGTTVDKQSRVGTAEKVFAELDGVTRWLSVEPMTEPLTFTRLDLFDWIVIGGASKSNETPAWVPPLDWLVDIHVQARAAGCKIYYKDNTMLPPELRLREFPWEERVERELPPQFKA